MPETTLLLHSPSAESSIAQEKLTRAQHGFKDIRLEEQQPTIGIQPGPCELSMSVSPWSFSAAMELPLSSRPLNSSSSESSIDSGFESPLSKDSFSPVSQASAAPSFSDAIATTSNLSTMLNRLSLSSASTNHHPHYHPHTLTPKSEPFVLHSPIVFPHSFQAPRSTSDAESLDSSSPELLELSPIELQQHQQQQFPWLSAGFPRSPPSSSSSHFTSVPGYSKWRCF